MPKKEFSKDFKMNVNEAYQVLKNQPEKLLEAYFNAYGEEYFKKFKNKQELVNDFINFKKNLFYRNFDEITTKIFRGFLIGLYFGFGINSLSMQSGNQILLLIILSILVIFGESTIKSISEKQQNGK